MRKIFLVGCLLSLWTGQGHAAFNMTWGLPSVGLSSIPTDGDVDLNPKIALDSFGNAVAIWGRTKGDRAAEDIWAAYYDHATRTWSHAEVVSSGANASNPGLAIDALGNVTLVWEEGFPSQIMSRTFKSGDDWASLLNEAPVGVANSLSSASAPCISVDAVGNLLVVWLEYSSGKYHVHSAKKEVGGAWQNLGRISSGKNSAHLHFVTPLVTHGEKNGIAVWEEENSQSGISEVHGALYADGLWSAPLPISTQGAKHPSADLDPNGNGIVVWEENGVIRSKTVREKKFSAPVFNASNPLYAARHPSVWVDDAGNGVLVFERFDVPLGEAPHHQFIAGATLLFNAPAWSKQVDISGPSEGSAVSIGAGYPVLSLNSIGDGVVVWKEYTGSHLVIQGAGFSLGTWSLFKPVSIGAPKGDGKYDLGISVNVAGDVAAIWPNDAQNPAEPHVSATLGVGLAIESPQPPIPGEENIEEGIFYAGVAYGTQILHRFPAHGDLINILRWSTEQPVSYYRIYRGTLSNLIGTSPTPYFEDHRRKSGKKETYLVTAVDANEQESSPLTILVEPL